jgi:hypothetical protein
MPDASGIHVDVRWWVIAEVELEDQPLELAILGTPTAYVAETARVFASMERTVRCANPVVVRAPMLSLM